MRVSADLVASGMALVCAVVIVLCIITSWACTRGKVIGFIIFVVVVHTKIMGVLASG